MKDKSEVEVVDLALKLREKLVRSLLYRFHIPGQKYGHPLLPLPSRCGHRATRSP